MNVYKAIGAVSASMSHEGISKARKNTQQGYNFRGIEDVLNALSAAVVQAGLDILPRCTERTVIERETKSGGALFNVTCKVEFDLVCTEDGSKHTVCTYGEAMDSADKATNKAMSAAYKYAAMQAFCIPTEGDNDADATTHAVQPQQGPTVTRDQADTLEALIQDVGADRGRFLDYFKVNALGLIPATDYDRAVDALEAKRAK